jgi:transposase
VRSKGGLNTKIHAIVDGLGNPVEFLLSPGNEHDSSHAVELLAKTDISGSNIIGDKAYGAKAIRDFIVSSGGALHNCAAVQRETAVGLRQAYLQGTALG